MTDTNPSEFEALEAKVDALQRKLNDAVERIEELEDGGASGSTEWSTASPYMNAVLEHTEPGQTVKRYNIEQILRTHTNVSNPKTVRNKVKGIVRMGPFEPHAEINQTWVRTEVETDE